MYWILFFLFSTIHAADIKWSGSLSSETFSQFESAPKPTRDVDPILWFKPELDIKWNKRSRLRLNPTLRINPATELKPEQIFFNPSEIYWDIKMDSFRFDIGSNVHNWGSLDGYSPLDIVNGRTLFNPLSGDRRGAPMVDLSFSKDNYKLQALYIPKQARTLLPSADSRWLPREFIANASSAEQTILLPQSFNYYYPGYLEIDSALKNNYGMRTSITFDNLDAHFVYFNGMSNNTQNNYQFQADVVSIDPLILQARSDIGITPVYFRTETAGASFIWAPSDIILKFESAYSRTTTKRVDLPEWSWQSGLALEIPLSVLEFSTTTVLQVYYGENKDPAENAVSSNSRLFDRAAIIGQRIEWLAHLDTFLSVLWDYQNQGQLVTAKMNYALNDFWKASGQVDVLTGQDASLFGTYKNNDRFIFSLQYLW